MAIVSWKFWPVASQAILLLLTLATIALQRLRATGYCRCSGPKEHKPDDAQDQNCQAGGDCQQGKHRRTRFGLPCFGRSFDDLIALSGCHGDLIPDVSVRLAAPVESNA
jgi:hypothetical protein